jgi:hypothetical protein
MSKVLDLFLISGWKAIFQISLAIIRDLKQRLFDECRARGNAYWHSSDDDMEAIVQTIV